MKVETASRIARGPCEATQALCPENDLQRLPFLTVFLRPQLGQAGFLGLAVGMLGW